VPDADAMIDVALRFVERINRRDLDGLTELMTPAHRFVDLAGDVDVGRERMQQGWAEYFRLCPDYMIHISRISVQGNVVALAGRTTGSHLGLPRAEEFHDEPVIWLARIDGDRISEWCLIHDTPETRSVWGLGGRLPGF
jgi:hypothetical protein